IAAPGPAEPGKTRPAPSAAVLPNQLSPAEKAAVSRLQQRDQQVKQEEKAHAAVAGDLAGPINYVYQLGPDGRQYAVGGSVGIQASALSGDPADAKRQAGRIAAAANAATNPSAQDYAAARQAYALGDQLKGSTVTDERQPGVSLLL
ncbi:MAG: putative metalloprotease CJM1_0395 family protein, partial [Pseudomonadota bacterium]